MKINIEGERLILDKDRALYFEKHQLLAISDLHLGKSAHFRKAGLQVPANVGRGDLERLSSLIRKYQPNTLLINGDMFHHDLNADVEEFRNWRAEHKNLKLLLVKGNHDRLNEADYIGLDIQVFDSHYCLGPFCFIHDAPTLNQQELYPISGHIHPGVSLVGKAKQRLKFPCFYFGQSYAVLPAFSFFTGLYQIKPKPMDRIFAITSESVVEV